MKEARRLANLKQSIFSVSVHPNGTEAACATSICDVVFCRLTVEGPPEPVEHRGATVCYSPDGVVFSSTIDEEIIFSDVTTGRFLRSLEWHKQAVLAMAFSPDGARIASGGKRELMICDVRSGMPVQRFPVQGVVSGVRFTPDGYRLVTSNHNSSVTLWDCVRGEKVRDMQGECTGARCVAVSADGSRILAGGEGAQLRLWELETGRCMQTYECGNPVWSVAFTPDGRHAFCGGYNRLMLWDVESGAILGQHDEVINGYFFVGMLPGGKQAVSGSLRGCFRLWDLFE